MIKKDTVLKPIQLHPYTPGEQWIIGPADPPGAPISGNPQQSQKQSQDTDKSDDRKP
jgi:hypothetical protein